MGRASRREFGIAEARIRRDRKLLSVKVNSHKIDAQPCSWVELDKKSV
jgi:hypothetical protein